MSTPDPQDLPDRLHVDADAPGVEPGFFDSLGFAATLSTPTAGAGLAARVRKSKVAAAIGATAVLLSGAAYAGGLVGGGDGHDATPLTPAHTSSQDAPRADEDNAKGSGSAGSEDKQAVQPRSDRDKHEGSGSGTGPATPPAIDPSSEGDDSSEPDSDGRPHCGWGDWGDWWPGRGGDKPWDDDKHHGDGDDGWSDRSWGDRSQDKSHGDQGYWSGRGCEWRGHDWGGQHWSDQDWGDNDWGDNDGSWRDHDWGDDNGSWRDQDWGDQDWGDNDGNWDGHSWGDDDGGRRGSD